MGEEVSISDAYLCREWSSLNRKNWHLLHAAFGSIPNLGLSLVQKSTFLKSSASLAGGTT